ncbi:MAG: thioester domain-containing protein, partial [Blautia producta]|nr:thioester domain-containing protein [Blautia producta]MDU5385514.1 thioester domain-containing protein [Blautia producta]
MKSRSIKTRMAAFGLALLMGLSPLGNLADVHAAEIKNPSEPVAESAEASEMEQTEGVSEVTKQLVAAEDITKDISDKDFMAETCMEGIHYDPEKEDVTLERIEAEDGSAYHPDQAGTYVATYWVVPKDERDGYSVTRKIILTDTEGQAHAEENGGQKQKEDTKSEEDSETPVQEIPDVEVTVSGEDVDAQAARELEEKIEDGEVMMLSSAENTFTARETVHLEKGETIYYPSYIGNYLTCWFTVNGKIAYCL